MRENGVFGRILAHANRADPYPLYAELRKTPVSPQEDGSYVVSTYREIAALLHDPRVSSDRRNLDERFACREPAGPLPPAFIGLDPPEHDRLRLAAMRHFGPPGRPGLLDDLRPELTAIVTGLIDTIAAATRADLVEAVAYPFPMAVICDLLGVPRADASRLHALSTEIVRTVGPGEDGMAERQRRRRRATAELGRHLSGLADARHREPREDLLSGLLDGDGEGMTPADAAATATLLLVAGHETTVNLIAGGMLTLLRHPEALERLRRDPGLAARTVEELLRYEPPVHFPATRVALDDITIGDVTIPRGSPIVLALAAGNRDPGHVSEPERFDPGRTRNEHLGFGGGVHYCFGAPLARLETQIALGELARRLRNPRLVIDPPPYRPSPALRGPRRLLVDFDRIE